MIIQTLAGTLIAVALGIAAAAAQGTQAQREACTGDAIRLCGPLIPDEAKIEQCLSSNVAKLAPACKAQFAPQRITSDQRRSPRLAGER